MEEEEDAYEKARTRARSAKNLSIDNPKNQKCKSVYLADGTRERVLHDDDGNDELCVCLFLCVCVCVCVDVFASCASAGLIVEREREISNSPSLLL